MDKEKLWPKVTSIHKASIVTLSEHQHYLAKLLGYNYSIQYRPGSDNVTMDALCIDVTLGHNFSLSIPHFQFLDRLC